MIRTGLLLSALLVAAMAGLSAYGFAALPPDAMLASHWNLAGEVDAHAPRDAILFGLPALALVIGVFFALVPLLDPRRENVRRSKGLLLSAWVGAVGVVALAHGAIVLAAINGAEPDIRIIATGIGALLIAIGNFMAKSRSSWFLGFRTPWTLSSEHAWVAANRTGGWLLVLTGAGTIAAAWLSVPRDGFLVLAAGLMTTLVAGIAVSYFAWRADPEKQTG